ncbi:MAG: TIGR00266 family protein [Oscillospiraceae bacterium]
MQYEIFGNNLPAVTLTLQPGESIYTQSGGMTWMTDGIAMETNMKGGLGKALGRMLSGESLFMATYTSQRPNTQITLAYYFPGSIIPLELGNGREFVCQKTAFLCATPGVALSAMVQKLKVGFFGGEGFIMQRLGGTGLAFLEIDGTVVAKDLAPGEVLKVDTGNIAAYEASMSYTAETVKGFKNVLFGGEGLFLSILRGPGRVYLQTVNISEFASKIIPYIPAKSGD